MQHTTVHKRPAVARAWLSAAIDPELKRDLLELARREERSLSAEVRRGLRFYLAERRAAA